MVMSMTEAIKSGEKSLNRLAGRPVPYPAGGDTKSIFGLCYEAKSKSQFQRVLSAPRTWEEASGLARDSSATTLKNCGVGSSGGPDASDRERRATVALNNLNASRVYGVDDFRLDPGRQAQGKIVLNMMIRCCRRINLRAELKSLISIGSLELNHLTFSCSGGRE